VPIAVASNTIEDIVMKVSPNADVRKAYEMCVVEKNGFYSDSDDEFDLVIENLINGKVAYYGSANYLIGNSNY